MVEITKGLPIPARRRNKSWQVILLKLKVGDSFEVDGFKQAQSVYSSAKNIGIGVSWRRLESRKIRVWRVR